MPACGLYVSALWVREVFAATVPFIVPLAVFTLPTDSWIPVFFEWIEQHYIHSSNRWSCYSFNSRLDPLLAERPGRVDDRGGKEAKKGRKLSWCSLLVLLAKKQRRGEEEGSRLAPPMTRPLLQCSLSVQDIYKRYTTCFCPPPQRILSTKKHNLQFWFVMGGLLQL